MSRRLPLAVALLAALAGSLAAQEGPEISGGFGLLYPSRRTVREAGQSDQTRELYAGGPVLEAAGHWRQGRWLEPRLRGTAFWLFKGTATTADGTPLDAESYGFTLVGEGQLHLWRPDRPGPYLTFGGGLVGYHYAFRDKPGSTAAVSGNDGGVTVTGGLGVQFGAGWELELRYDGHLTTREVTVAPLPLLKADPNPSSFLLVLRRRG
jgi:hypothetical protein